MAAYWDGRNHLGESVASGLYFYTLTAGEFSATTREDADTEISSRHIVVNPDFIGAPYAVNSANQHIRRHFFMSKRYLVPHLIGACKQHHRIVLIGLLIFIVGSQNVYPQQQIAQDAYAIFEQSCLICHGPDGAYKETLLIEHNALIQNGTVVPGNPDASELYNRLLTTDAAKRMPLGQPQLSTQAIDTIRNWILADAPDWAAAGYNQWRLYLSC